MWVSINLGNDSGCGSPYYTWDSKRELHAHVELQEAGSCMHTWDSKRGPQAAHIQDVVDLIAEDGIG